MVPLPVSTASSQQPKDDNLTSMTRKDPTSSSKSNDATKVPAEARKEKEKTSESKEAQKHYAADEPLMTPDVQAFISDRGALLAVRVGMMKKELLVPRDDSDLTELEGKAISDPNAVQYLPYQKLPNAREGTIAFRILAAAQYQSIFLRPWDQLFPQRPSVRNNYQGNAHSNNMRHGHHQSINMGQDPKWDQPENLNNQAANMMGGVGIFNLGDIRNARAPQQQSYPADEVTNARDMEAHMQAEAVQRGGYGHMPSYPSNEYGNRSRYPQNNAHSDLSQRIKGFIGVSSIGNEQEPSTNSAPSSRDAATRSEQSREKGYDMLQNLQNYHAPGQSQTVQSQANAPVQSPQTDRERGTTRNEQAQSTGHTRAQLSTEDRQLYEYYQQCIPALKCVEIDALPEYIAMNPHLQSQIARLDEEVRASQARRAQYYYAASQQYQYQYPPNQTQGAQAASAQNATSGNQAAYSEEAVAQQQWLRQQQLYHQQALHQQMLAAAAANPNLTQAQLQQQMVATQQQYAAYYEHQQAYMQQQQQQQQHSVSIQQQQYAHAIQQAHAQQQQQGRGSKPTGEKQAEQQ